jgi:hypothetical protein
VAREGEEDLEKRRRGEEDLEKRRRGRERGGAIMADKPARALVIYGDGIMPAVKAHHEHLHRLAASGSCGFLALRTLPPVSSLSEGEREVIELAQLLDVYDIYTEKARKEDSAGEIVEDGAFKSLAERFMGMKSTFVTNSKPALALSKRAGFSVNSLEEFGVDSDASATASKALGLLGFNESKESPNELVFLHLDSKSGSSAESGAEFLNSLVECVQESSKEGSLAYGRLFFVVVLGYGDAQASGESVPSLRDETELPSALAALRPRQSYTMKAGKPVEGIREEYPLLAVYNQVAVTRRDEVQKFLFEDWFLYEVAFKLWKAPKYGA